MSGHRTSRPLRAVGSPFAGPPAALAHAPAHRRSTRSSPPLERLRQQGKVRFYGITALGDTAAFHRVLDAGGLATAPSGRLAIVP
jgi:hypothetical protein